MQSSKNTILDQTQKKIRSGIATNPITVVIESENQGDFYTKVSVRDHLLESDQPFGFFGQNRGPKPSELVLAALAACQETTYRIYAEDMGIEIEKIAVRLTGTQDLRGFMALDEGIPAGFSLIEGIISIKTSANQQELEKLQKRVDRYCPVLDDLLRPVDVKLTVNKIG